MVAESEGNKSCVYKDSLGIPTIGIGFNLKRGDG
jgi:GH24 family phage-related lysozyme (muramidase)